LSRRSRSLTRRGTAGSPGRSPRGIDTAPIAGAHMLSNSLAGRAVRDCRPARARHPPAARTHPGWPCGRGPPPHPAAHPSITRAGWPAPKPPNHTRGGLPPVSLWGGRTALPRDRAGPRAASVPCVAPAPAPSAVTSTTALTSDRSRDHPLSSQGACVILVFVWGLRSLHYCPFWVFARPCLALAVPSLVPSGAMVPLACRTPFPSLCPPSVPCLFFATQLFSYP